MDRIDDIIRIKAIGLVENLKMDDIDSLSKRNIPGKLVDRIKAAGLNPDNLIEKEILVQCAQMKAEERLLQDVVYYNGIYFERKAPRDSSGDKILYSYKDSVKRVHSFNGRHAYPNEAFSFLIANLEGRLNSGQKEVADDMLDNYGEWLCECERRRNKLVVYLDGSADMEFNVKEIPSMQYVGLGKFPEEFVTSIYSRSFEELPEKIKMYAQVFLPPDGKKWPLGRGGYYDFNDVYYYSRVSRWVAVRKNFP